MFVKAHALHKLKIRRYTKLVSNLVDDSLGYIYNYVIDLQIDVLY